MPYRTAAARAVSTVLALDGLFHLYWATGATWPAADTRTLSYAVLGSDVPFTLPVLLPLAALLLGGSATVALRTRHRLLRYGTFAVAAGLGLRALAGLAWMTVLPVDAPDGSAFHWLNPAVYTPLCGVLAAASLLAARTEASPRAGGGSTAGGDRSTRVLRGTGTSGRTRPRAAAGAGRDGFPER